VGSSQDRERSDAPPASYARFWFSVVSFAARLRRRSTGPPSARAAASVENVGEDAWATVPSLRRITYRKRPLGSAAIERRSGRSALCWGRQRVMRTIAHNKSACRAFVDEIELTIFFGLGRETRPGLGQADHECSGERGAIVASKEKTFHRVPAIVIGSVHRSIPSVPTVQRSKRHIVPKANGKCFGRQLSRRGSYFGRNRPVELPGRVPKMIRLAATKP
jgi:hypothetical protein